MTRKRWEHAEVNTTHRLNDIIVSEAQMMQLNESMNRMDCWLALPGPLGVLELTMVDTGTYISIQ
jgi:hypothetical protein